MKDNIEEAHYRLGLRHLEHAQIHATLALAEEQRTANLIAWYGDGPQHGWDESYAKLHKEIVERLGLRQTEGPF